MIDCVHKSVIISYMIVHYTVRIEYLELRKKKKKKELKVDALL